MAEDIKKVFTGTRIEAMFLKEMLEESDMGVFMKDVLASSIKSGWADGPLGDSVFLFVEASNEAKAKYLIEEYQYERDKSDDTDNENQD